MFEIRVDESFSAAHQLKGYKGKCARLHGHNYKINVYIQSDILDSMGMVFDFCLVKKMCKTVLKEFDHHYLNDLKYFKTILPTTEVIAKILYNKFEKKIRRLNKNLYLSKIRVWESDHFSAIYSPS